MRNIHLRQAPALRRPSSLGTAPLHVAAPGKVSVAFLPEAELERVLATLTFMPLTPGTITHQDTFQTELCRARVRGYTVSAGARSP